MATSSNHFLALLRFSLGIDREFNFRPTAGEWVQLYEQSLRQSLVGVTYEGVSRLPEDCFEPAASGGADAQTHLPQLLALQWANDAEVIAGLNVVDRIAHVSTDRYDRPERPVRIQRVRPNEQMNKRALEEEQRALEALLNPEVPEETPEQPEKVEKPESSEQPDFEVQTQIDSSVLKGRTLKKREERKKR